MHRLDEKELKLAALALDEAYQNGELATASLKFFESLRRRGLRIEAFGLPEVMKGDRSSVDRPEGGMIIGRA